MTWFNLILCAERVPCPRPRSISVNAPIVKATHRMLMNSRDELGLLGEAFNDMLTQIQWRDTALQQAHDELEQRVIERTAQLEAANHELEAFSYSISHDLRAPLRATNGFARILLEEHAPHLADEAQEYLQLIRDNAQYMGQLLDDLLAFARLSRQPLTKQPVAPAGPGAAGAQRPARHAGRAAH